MKTKLLAKVYILFCFYGGRGVTNMVKIFYICGLHSIHRFVSYTAELSAPWMYETKQVSWNSSSGPLRGPRTPATPLWAVFLLVPGLGVWESAHHSGFYLQLPPPHPHGLLPLTPVFSDICLNTTMVPKC